MNASGTDRVSEWLQVGLQIRPESVETVSEILARYGHQGGVAIQEAYQPAEDGVTLQRDPGGPVHVCTYIPRDQHSEETLQRIQVSLDLLDPMEEIGPLQIRTLVEEDWAHSWKQYYQILRISERIVVVPAWREYPPGERDVVLILDPGMAFGTGTHPTTQLCLRALERYLRPGARVLDLGSGSGILAIAAAKLGSGSVLALDTDPLAVEAARENIQANRVGAGITAGEGTLQAGQGPFDLILANILAGTIQELAPLLASALTDRGVLVASGILVEQAEAVAAALAQAGLQLIEQPEQEGWVGLVASRTKPLP